MVLLYLLLGVAVCGIFGFIAYSIFMEIYSQFDHYYWPDDALPCEEAEIVDQGSERVIYTKNNAKFKTTIYFNDGFQYVTYHTDRDDGFLTYRISVNQADVRSLAYCAHAKQIARLKKQGKRIYTVEEIVENERAKEKAANQGKWQCSCGRINQAYETSCVCGATKADAKRKER